MSEQSNPVQNVTFASNGDEAYGYLSLPASGHGPGVIVIQEWWGLTTHMAHIADRLAQEGFVALAPDLYGGTTTHDEGEALQLLLELPVDRAARDLGGAVDYLFSLDEVVGTTVGVVGFCMGGSFALQLAVQEGGRIAAAVAFYPVGYMPDDYAGLQAPVLVHIADRDAINPPTLAEELNQKISAGGRVTPEIDHYPAGHAFLNEEDLLGTFDAEQARIAWNRTVAFLGARLTRPQ
jgi:carboxymethylenebutenolidase